MRSASDFDAVTIDAFGTLVELDDVVPRLQAALRAQGVEAAPEDVTSAFDAEVRYYLVHKVEGRDPESLARLGRECAGVFLAELGAGLDAAAFAPDFVAALVFRPLPGVVAALEQLAGAGLVLACVSDWDVSVAAQLERAGVRRFLATVVSSAEVGVEKPDPAVFRVALDRLGIAPERALHVGDGDGDRRGAKAAGLAFEHAPVATLPARLGIR